MPIFRTACLALLALPLCLAIPAQARDFTLESYFAGRTVAEGQFSAINGLKRSFKVNLTGKWNGKRLLLREDFVYADGERDRKTWSFRKTGATTYSGTREDVIGTAEVTVRGNTVRFSYLVDLAPGPDRTIVRFHDKMVLRPDGTVLNTAWVSKFGFPVARTEIVFHRK